MSLYVAWAVMILGEWIVAAIALRNIRKTYPCFTALVCVMAMKSVALFYIRATDPVLYFYAYYRSEFLVSVLQLASAVEVFGTLFRPFWVIPKKSLTTLTLATVVAISVIVKTQVAFISGDARGEWLFYQTLDKVSSSAIALTLGACLLFSKHFEMPYRSRLRGIAIGLFIMSVMGVLMSFATATFTQSVIIMLSFVPILAHYASLTIWTYHLSRKEQLSAVLDRADLGELRNLLNQFTLALSYTPTSCGLTMRKQVSDSGSEEKAKMVKHNG